MRINDSDGLRVGMKYVRWWQDQKQGSVIEAVERKEVAAMKQDGQMYRRDLYCDW